MESPIASRFRIEVRRGGEWLTWSVRDSEKGAKIAAANARRSRHNFADVRVVQEK